MSVSLKYVLYRPLWFVWPEELQKQIQAALKRMDCQTKALVRELRGHREAGALTPQTSKSKRHTGKNSIELPPKPLQILQTTYSWNYLTSFELGDLLGSPRRSWRIAPSGSGAWNRRPR